jgi:PAS domain S-box-containing protein
MKLAPTLQRAAPTDRCTSSINLFDNIDQWRPLFERSALGVAMIDSGFHFLVANPAFLTMFGYSSEELQKLSFLDICIDEAGDECRISLRELREGVRRQYEIETQHRRKDGTFLPVNTYFSAIGERGPNQQTFLTVTGRYFGTPGGRRCVARGSNGAGEDRTTNNGGRDGSDNRARTQPTVSSDCIER